MNPNLPVNLDTLFVLLAGLGAFFLLVSLAPEKPKPPSRVDGVECPECGALVLVETPLPKPPEAR